MASLRHRVYLSTADDIKEGFISFLCPELSKIVKIVPVDDHHPGVEVDSIIAESTILLVIISIGYADAKCLNELVKLLECKKIRNQTLIPVLYGLTKSDIMSETGKFRGIYSQSKEFKSDWESALKEVTGLIYWDSKKVGNDLALVRNIVGDIWKRLTDTSTSDSKDDIGLKSRIEELEGLLSNRSEGTFTLGLWAGAGMGKTTLARALFEKISEDFEVVHFVENVKEESERRSGLTLLLQDLRSKLLGDEMDPKKVFIVLDDVTNPNQVQFLIGEFACFGPGSLVIITARDKSVFKGCGVDKEHKVKRLYDNEDHKLFIMCAIGENITAEVCPDISRDIVEYAKGVPLALKILGSCLYGKRRSDWARVLTRLKESLPLNIYKVLRIGYRELGLEEQKLFREIVRDFDGDDVTEVKRTLNATFTSVERGIDILVQRSLITIIDGKITMLCLVKEMGRLLLGLRILGPEDKFLFSPL